MSSAASSGQGQERAPRAGRLVSARDRATAGFFGTIVTLTDLLPPRIRYGYAHRVTRALFRTALPSLQASSNSTIVTAKLAPASPPTPGTRCVLAADHLDIGGIGSVIEMLARGLGEFGVQPIVICQGDGQRASLLRSLGIQVISVIDLDSAKRALTTANPEVIQLHSAPGYLEQAALESGVPLVTAMHNTEIHFTRARWRSFIELMTNSVAGVAVSEIVREFHARQLEPATATRLKVVPNGAPTLPATSPEQRADARRSLGAALGTDLGDDVVFVCLARYDAQKNIAGTVAAYAAASERDVAGTRLIFAGDPSDWAELHRAKALGRAGARADRVHLLGNSDAVSLLRAADAFVLNSFFEGWPVAATEAAAAGLPLLLSDVGGAAELVARDQHRSILIPNATGAAADVTDARVSAARRRTTHQPNASALTSAFGAISNRLRLDGVHGSPSAAETERAGVAEMVRAHAEILQAAAHSK